MPQLMPDTLKLTPTEQQALQLTRHYAKLRHERARKAALQRGRRDFPDLPFECSWAYEEEFRRQSRAA